MDGCEATKKIRELETRDSKSETRIIAVTAVAFEEEQAAALSAGCDDIVRKPFYESEIFDMMRRYLGIRYVYEEDAKSSTGPSTSSGHRNRQSAALEEAITPEALGALPPELLAALEQASMHGDTDRAVNLAGEIRSHNAALADALAALAADFEYGKILKLIRKQKQGRPR